MADRVSDAGSLPSSFLDMYALCFVDSPFLELLPCLDGLGPRQSHAFLGGVQRTSWWPPLALGATQLTLMSMQLTLVLVRFNVLFCASSLQRSCYY